MRYLLLLFCVLTLSSGGVEIQSDGRWSLEGISARWNMMTPDWHHTYGIKETIRKLDAARSVLEAKGKKVYFQTFAAPSSSGAIQVESRVYSDDFPDIGHVSYSISIPLEFFRQLTVNGEKLSVPAIPAQVHLKRFPMKRHSLEIEMNGGSCIVEGDFSIGIQDNRKWSNELQIRLNSSAGRRSGSYEIKFQLRHLPIKSKSVSLTEAANLGIRNGKVVGGESSWINPNARKDLSTLQPGRLFFDRIGFDLIDPAGNDGKQCLVLSADGKDFPASAELPVDGGNGFKYLYLLHTSADTPPSGDSLGTVLVTCENSRKERFPIQPGKACGNWQIPVAAENAGIAWTPTATKSCTTLYASVFPLSGRPAHLSFTAENSGKWLIFAATLSEHFVKPGEATERVVLMPGKEWQPVKFDRTTKPGSPLDFSAHLDAPAGKHGRVIIDDNGHFILEKSGERIRFLGVNICSTSNYYDRKEAEEFADEIARIGYNSVRFHHFENDLLDPKAADSTTFNPAMLDKLQYLMYCLKKRGIYYTLDLYASRRLRPGDGIREWNSRQKTKLLFNIEPTALENWKIFVRKLLLAPNPYTGLTPAEDPALYVVNLVNENDIASGFPGSSDPVVARKFQQCWNRYLKQNGIAGVPGTNTGTFLHFLNQLERARIHEQVRFLRENIKTSVLVTDLNLKPDYNLNGPHSELQVVDIHTYWDHMTLLVPGRWYPPLYFRQSSALEQDAGHIRWIMPARIFGRPFISTEINYCNPNRFRTELGPMFGAYAALQDYDGLYRFAWMHSKRWNKEEDVTGLNVYNDPLALFSDRLLYLLFMRGDVSPAPGGAAVDYRENALQNMNANAFEKVQKNTEEFSRLGLLTRIGVLEEGRSFKGIPKVNLTGNWQEQLPAERKNALKKALKSGTFLSETKEISLSPREKKILVVTPRTEALSGCSDLHGKILHATGITTPQTVAISSLDGKTLAESRKILMFHLVNMGNRFQSFRNRECTILDSYGTRPLLIERRKTTVSLHLPHKWKIETLDLSGRQTGTVKTDYENGILHFTADTALRPHGVMAYLLTR